MGSFAEPIEAAEPLDAVVCAGNSLALAASAAVARRAVGHMLAAVRPGGAVLVQVLNLWSLPNGRSVWQKRRRATLPGGEALIVKGVHRAAGSGWLDLIVTGLGAEDALQAESLRLLGLKAAELEEAARRGGAAEVSFFGGYQGQPYDRSSSVDLVMVAAKQR